MRVLFLSRWFPHPPDNGAKLRILNNLRYIGARHELVLIALGERSVVADLEAHRALRAFCARVHAVPYRSFRPSSPRAVAALLSNQPRFLIDTFQPKINTLVEAEIKRELPDVIVASQIDMLPYALRKSGVPVVPVVLEELELSIHADAATTGMRSKLTWFKLSHYLKRVLPRLAACTVASEREAANVRRIISEYDRLTVIPNAVDVAAYRGDYGAVEPDSLIFSGALTYQPNEDAMRFFLAEVYPRVLAEVPQAHLKITGAQPKDMSPLPSQANVVLTGAVADVRPLIARSAVSVVPLRVGGGTRLKILEAMALSTPVVATSKGAEGLAATPGENLLIADTPAEMAAAIVRLLRSPDARHSLANAARRLVETHYDAPVIGARLEALLESVVIERTA
jgi:glycosyltransferase involved in cell wall biosynthesis